MSDRRSDLDAARDTVGLIGKQALSVMREADAFRNEALALRAEVARLRGALAKVTAVAKAEDARNCMSCTSTAVILAALQETRHE